MATDEALTHIPMRWSTMWHGRRVKKVITACCATISKDRISWSPTCSVCRRRLEERKHKTDEAAESVRQFLKKELPEVLEDGDGDVRQARGAYKPVAPELPEETIRKLRGG